MQRSQLVSQSVTLMWNLYNHAIAFLNISRNNCCKLTERLNNIVPKYGKYDRGGTLNLQLLTFAICSVSSISFLAAALIRAACVPALGVLVTCVQSSYAFVHLNAIVLAYALIARKAFAHVRANGVNAFRVLGHAVVAIGATLVSALVNVCKMYM